MRVHSKGDRVSQKDYGPGTVTEANERHTVIDFDNHGIRTFSTPIVTLEKTSEPAPPGTPGARRKKTTKSAKAVKTAK